MNIVLASGNLGKLQEFKELFKGLPFTLVPQSELNVSEVEETGLSFIENAILKARHAAKMTGLPALADDSGLAVDVLNGEPGIYSARYAGKQATSSDNIQKLLLALHDKAAQERHAQFHCVLAFVAHENDPTPLICEGIWKGIILKAPQGEGGFGYDPIFYVPTEQKSAAELPSAVKNKISHRGMALQSLLKHLPEKLCTLSQSKI